MFGSVVLDVAIGMSFVYLLLSLIASVVQEILSTFMQLRAANLERALRSLFSGETIPAAVATTAKDIEFAAATAAAAAKGEQPPARPAPEPARSLVASLYDHGLVRGLYSDPGTDLALEGADKWTEPGKLFRRFGNQLRFFLRWIIGIRPGKGMGVGSDPMLLPAYIPSDTFALALIDLLNPGKATGAATVPAIVNLLAEDKGKVAQAIRTLAIASEGDLTKFQTKLETWYNSAMDRASGWYKHYVQTILLGIGMVLAILFNVDSIKVARTLWTDRDVRQAMVQAASDYNGNKPPDPTANVAGGADGAGDAAKKQADLKSLTDKLETSSQAFDDVAKKTLLPVGWKVPLSEHWSNFYGGTRRWSLIEAKLGNFANWQLFFGWCITAMALSLGAPFWFDTLNRFMVVRGTVKPKEKK